MSLLNRLFSGRKKRSDEETERMMDSMRNREKTPEDKARMMDALKPARLEMVNRVYENLPEQLRNSDKLIRAIAEQINYATASAQFEGDDAEMRRKLEALVAELQLHRANEASEKIISAVE